MHFLMRDQAPRDRLLSGRELGDKARHDLERAIGALMPGDAVALDFSDIAAVSVPFVDNFLGPLLSGRLGGYYEEHPFVILGASDDVEETIAAALMVRGLSALSIGSRGARLLGSEPSLDETVRFAQDLGEFSATDLAAAFDLTPQAANNRLKALWRAGALTRQQIKPERGGKEFRYRLPRPDSERRRRRRAPTVRRVSGNGTTKAPS